MGFLWFIPLMVLIFIGVPVAFSLGIISFLGIVNYLGLPAALAQLKTVAFGATSNYTLSVIPMFVLMGEFSFQSGISRDLFNATNKWMSRLPGGLAIATNFAAAIFGACSGSTIASASIFTKIALPEMTKVGYDKRLSTGAIASSGALACMIPPSILIVIYGIITIQPINKLLVAGIFPGVFTAIMYGLGIYLIALYKPSWAPVSTIKVPLREKLLSLAGILPTMFLFALVIGGLYMGWFTSTMAGAIGASGALIVLIVRGQFTIERFRQAIYDTGMLTCLLLFIIVFGNLFSFMLSTSGVVQDAVQLVSGIGVSPSIVLILILGIYIVLGMFIDPISMIIITAPAVVPVAGVMGYDPVWFGIIIITMLEVGVLTPPVGMNLYAVKAVAGDSVTTHQIFSGVGMFLIMKLIVIALMLLFPQVVLYLPNSMF